MTRQGMGHDGDTPHSPTTDKWPTGPTYSPRQRAKAVKNLHDLGIKTRRGRDSHMWRLTITPDKMWERDHTYRVHGLTPQWSQALNTLRSEEYGRYPEEREGFRP